MGWWDGSRSVHVVIAGKADGPQIPAGEKLAADLEAAGLRVLLDDRYGPSPGVKFKDAELVGIPYRVTVGPGRWHAGAAPRGYFSPRREGWLRSWVGDRDRYHYRSPVETFRVEGRRQATRDLTLLPAARVVGRVTQVKGGRPR